MLGAYGKIRLLPFKMNRNGLPSLLQSDALGIEPMVVNQIEQFRQRLAMRNRHRRLIGKSCDAQRHTELPI
jgi:hypothetical protein